MYPMVSLISDDNHEGVRIKVIYHPSQNQYQSKNFQNVVICLCA